MTDFERFTQMLDDFYVPWTEETRLSSALANTAITTVTFGARSEGQPMTFFKFVGEDRTFLGYGWSTRPSSHE